MKMPSLLSLPYLRHLLRWRRGAAALAVTVSAACLMSACGFHLRGSQGEAKLPFQTIYLGFAETSPLGIELQRNIRASGATKDSTTVVSDPKTAQAVLEVLEETRNKAILSLNSQGRVREYTLTYMLRFRVKDNAGREWMAPATITLRRTLNFDETQVLAQESEENLLYRDMQSDLVRQILRRLAAIKPPASAG